MLKKHVKWKSQFHGIFFPGYYFSFSEGINIILIGNIDTKFHEIDLILAFDFTSFFGLDFLKIFWPIVQRLIWFLYILKLDKWSITFYCFHDTQGQNKVRMPFFPIYLMILSCACYFTRFELFLHTRPENLKKSRQKNSWNQINN